MKLFTKPKRKFKPRFERKLIALMILAIATSLAIDHLPVPPRHIIVETVPVIHEPTATMQPTLAPPPEQIRAADQLTASRIIQKGDQAYYDRAFDRAISFYKDALKIEPTNSLAHYNIGSSYYAMGMNEQAVQYYTNAIAFHETPFIAYQNRGIVHKRMGNYDDAIRDFEQSLTYIPPNASGDTFAAAYQYLGLIYLERQEYDRAIANFTIAITVGNNDAKSYRGLGDVYFAMGQNGRAAGHYETYVELSMDHTMRDVTKRIAFINEDQS